MVTHFSAFEPPNYNPPINLQPSIPPPLPKTSPGDIWLQSLVTNIFSFHSIQYESNHHKQYLLIITSRDLRRTFQSLGSRKKILNPPSCTQNLCSLDLHQKQKDEILDPSCFPHTWIKPETQKAGEISASPKQDFLLQVRPPTRRLLEHSKLQK